MRKFLMVILPLSFLMLVSFNQVQAAGWEKEFFDDFENYPVGKVEDSDDFTARWTNDAWSGSNDKSVDINDVATIKDENGNKYLNINYTGSFFYMSPHNLRAKEFEVEFKTRSHDLTDAWLGVNTRREYRDTRFNGGTGLMIYFRSKYITDDKSNIIGESFAMQALRGGSLSTTDLTDDIVGSKVIEYLYPTDGTAIDPTKQIKGNWFNIKLRITETEKLNEVKVEAFVNDVLLGTLFHTRASLNRYGFISLNGCTGDIDVDDFKISVLDTVSPPPIVRVNKLIEQVTTINTELNLPGAKEGDVELIGAKDNKFQIIITTPKDEKIVLDDNVFTFTPTVAGVHNIKYTAINSDGVESYEEFLVNVKEEEAKDPETPENPEEPETPEDPAPKKKGCFGKSSALYSVPLLGLLFFFRRRRI